MAESTQLRTTGREEISEEDPFAELTRIMGFDPRVSVKQQDASSAQADAADDFAIDLEKELMGEFGGSEEAEAAPVEQASAGPRYDVESDASAALFLKTISPRPSIRISNSKTIWSWTRPNWLVKNPPFSKRILRR